MEMSKQNKKSMDENEVKIIKIGKEAIFEFIYENFIAGQEQFLDVDPLDVANNFVIDWKAGEFIFCAYKSEDSNGNIIKFPEEINLQKLMKNIPNTTSSMLSDNRFCKYTKAELAELSK